MKNTLAIFSLLLFAFLIAPTDIIAQEATPKRMEGVAWKNIVHVKFHAGKRGKAIGMIKDYFMKAADEAGTNKPEMMIEYATGEWDLALVWHMKGGVEDMTWETSPDNIAWRKALSDMVGGPEKADELYQEYLGLISAGKSEIGMVKNKY